MTEHAVYSVSQLAERWRCDPKTIRELVHSGKLSVFRVGKRAWRITAGAVAEYEAGARQKAG